MTCAACRKRAATTGVLCQKCRNRLAARATIAPEQIQQHGGATGRAALIDAWGRAFRLGPMAIVGRELVSPGVVLLEPYVSREHAAIEREGAIWKIRDLGSANGTYVDDVRIRRTTQLRDGMQVRFGMLPFYFVSSVAGLPVPGRASSETVRRPTLAMPATTDKIPEVSVEIELRQPTGGGGGVLEIDGKSLQLTIPQCELMSILLERRLAEPDHEGFVRAPELLETLSLESAEPGEDSLRQIVRRLRRAFTKAKLPDLIESRAGLGYRLSVIPRRKR